MSCRHFPSFFLLFMLYVNYFVYIYTIVNQNTYTMINFTEAQIQAMMSYTSGNRNLAIEYLKEEAEFNSHLGKY